MPLITSQSEIANVRDEMSLDYANGQYLNRVSANLGINRPPFGFSDAVWRAVVKAIALRPKQIVTKFEEILSIILGPKVTQCGAFLESTLVGDTSAVLVDSSQFPQVGTMVIDEGLATEETVAYRFIDRYTNRVYFETPLANAHTAVGVQWETGVISDVPATSTDLSVFDATGLPIPSATYTVCVGRGTEYEQAGPIATVNVLGRLVSTAFPITAGLTGVNFKDARVLSHSPIPSQRNVYYLTLTDTSTLVENDGHLQLGVSGTLPAVASGTVTSLTLAAPITPDVYGGYWVVFTGAPTAALAGRVGYVVSNDATTLTFSNTLPVAPAAGEGFSLLSNFQYIRTAYTDNTVLMRREFPDLLVASGSEQVHVSSPTTTLAIAQVQVKGKGWDVFQSDPRNVEILIPTDIFSNDLRSASYIRDAALTGSAFASANRIAGDLDIAVVTTSTIAIGGVLEHVPSGDRYSYYNPFTWLTSDAAVGATTIQVLDTSLFPSSGTLTINGNSLAYTVVDATSFTVAPLVAAVAIGDLVREENILKIARPLTAGILGGDAISFYASYGSGDYWAVPDVWPGPYVWNLFEEVRGEQTLPTTTLSSYVSGPTKLAVSLNATSTVLEVEDASCFPTGVPYSTILGENSGNIETIAVQELSLRSRTYTTLSAGTLAGVTQIPVVSLAGPLAPLNTFPNGGPYRVLLSPFTANQEVVEVIGTATAPNRLLLRAPATQPHSLGDRVVLLADLLRISPALADEHVGKVSQLDITAFYPPENPDIADLVRPIYTSATLSTLATDFITSGGNAVINFGNGVHKAESVLRTPIVLSTITDGLALNVTAGDVTVTVVTPGLFPSVGPYDIFLQDGATNEIVTVMYETAGVLILQSPVVNNYTAATGSASLQATGSTISLVDSSDFPTTSYPYTIYVDVDAGPVLQEVLHVTNNNTVTNELTVSHSPVFGHPSLRRVEFRPGLPENFSYTSVSGANVLSFSPRLEIEYTHHEVELLAPTVGNSYPGQNGLEFPLRLPVSIEDRIRYVIDLVRAAGVEVTFISKR